MATTFISYADIIAEAPSEDAMLNAFRIILNAAELEYRDLLSLTYKPTCNAESIRAHLNAIRFRLDAAENVIDASSVITDLHQCFTTPPAPEQEAAEEELPI